MRRIVAGLVLLLLGHAGWVSASAPCPVTMGGGAAGTSPPASHVGSHVEWHGASHVATDHHAAPAAAPSDPDAETPPAESPPHDAACLVAMTCAPMLVAASATLAGLELAPRRHMVDRAPRWRDGVRRAVEPPPPRVA